jgi:hypothetical protein
MTLFMHLTISTALLRRPIREKAFSAVGAACFSLFLSRLPEQYWRSCSAVAQLTSASAVQKRQAAICTPTPGAAQATRSAQHLAPARTDFSVSGVGISTLSVLMKIVGNNRLSYLPTALSVSVNQPRS